MASVAALNAALTVIGFPKRAWREGRNREAQQLLSDAEARLSRAPAGDRHRARILAASGYTAFLLGEEDEAKARISQALELNAAHARALLLELAETQALPKDEELKSWPATGEEWLR